MARNIKRFLLQMDAIFFYSKLSNYIRELLIENGDMEPDGDSPVKIKFDLTSFRCLVTIVGGLTLDLRNSKLRNLTVLKGK